LKSHLHYFGTPGKVVQTFMQVRINKPGKTSGYSELVDVYFWYRIKRNALDPSTISR